MIKEYKINNLYRNNFTNNANQIFYNKKYKVYSDNHQQEDNLTIRVTIDIILRY